ncbi:putative toxin-antitoxin system toxin component, PIN family [Aromatoleum tolulyticum]|uniref:Putative toxin-antitoxin system toxin component, PIN family n=1 Tax=Aromatoleum tolulyticum TaxID=34027 RepID=A0A1N6ZZF4_9RHOO|nr:putative toxin-antitoxin system toxin component, PIN family [Aromatoleum tolulyticum]SIR32214.1 putative toxin-antitoxin system toxin component, PIN family [Aromatoleum tolulyticum]
MPTALHPPPPAPSALRLVLDTNTVMALWAFEDPRLQHLRQWIEHDRAVLLASAATLEELRRVLAYRQFAIAPERQAAILATYAGRTCAVPAPDAAAEPPPLPACGDRDDQKFLETARDGRASHLVSRDKLLLKLNRHRLVRSLFAILTPEALDATLRDEPGA